MASEEEKRDENKMRKMAELRTTLEKRVKELQTELDQLRTLLDFVNSTVLEKSFKKPLIKTTAAASISEESFVPSPPSTVATEATPPVLEYAQTIPIKTATGDLLANLHIDEDCMRIVFAEEKQFTVDTPPFTAFLVERVLTKMQEKDRESAAAGEMPPDKILSYEITKEGDTIRELSIKNIGADRARELKSTIRWTLEKMYEKMKSTT